MPITITPEQETWLGAHVARGELAPIDEAARQLIDERIAERMLEEDDLAWAKSLVDEAAAAIARGEVIGLDEHKGPRRNKCVISPTGRVYNVMAGAGPGRRPAIHDFSAVRCKVMDGAPARTMTQEGSRATWVIRLFRLGP